MKQYGWILILLCTALLACLSCMTRDEPGMDITVANLEFQEATLFETTLVFTLRVMNESPEPVTVEGGVYRIDLNGVKVGKGVSDLVLEIPGFSTTTTPVTFHVSNIALLTRLKALLDNDSLHYRIKSKIYTRIGPGSRRLHILKEGILDFNEKSADTPVPDPG